MAAQPAVTPSAGDGDAAAAARLAARWAAALHGTSHSAMSIVPLTGFLHELAARTARARHGGPDARAELLGVGRELVAAHFTEPGTLERVLDVLRLELGGELGGEPGGDPRSAADVDAVMRVLATVAVGYTDAVRSRTRDEQERITTSALDARAAAERARWTSEARYAAVFSEAPVGIGVAEMDGSIIEVNRTLCDMFGLPPAAFTTRNMYEFVDAESEQVPFDLLQRMVAGGLDHVRTPKTYERVTGERLHTELALSLVRDPDGSPRYVVAMVLDLTDRRALEDRLRHQAEHDPLTGLPNRTLFFSRLDAALATGCPDVGVCFLDLDGFKGVNDTLGHPVGDALLRVVARRLAAALEPDGHLVARMGGDEFVVLTRGAPDDLGRVAEQVIGAVRGPVPLDGRELTISASVGVVSAGDAGAPRATAELMQAADTTLRRAKRDGRDRWARFDAAHHRRDIALSTRSARMADALARGEFEVRYQPLVRLADGRTTGVEALVRWRTEDGLLGPDEFVPLAEQSGLIVPLGRWVLEESCRRAAEWRDALAGLGAAGDAPLFVSVNLAARQVREPGLVDSVRRVLDETGWPATALQLEVTETDAMATAGEPLEVLHALSALGITLAIDDFGTGYSNLAYLRDLPVQVLKLAGPFITGRAGSAGVAGDEVDAAVLAHVVRLAHTLGLTVTAEHVETVEQVERLRALGCDTGQGYLFGRPVEADAVIELLRAAGA